MADKYRGPKGYHPRSEVLKWKDDIHAQRSSLGLTADQYSDSLVMAFIHYESRGNHRAIFYRKLKSGEKVPSAFGLLQLIKSLAGDYGIKDPQATLVDSPNGGAVAIHTFLRHMQRFKSSHQYVPDYIVTLWSRGAGTLKKLKKLIENEGGNLDSAGMDSVAFAYANAMIPFTKSGTKQQAIRKVEYASNLRILQENYAIKLGEKVATGWKVDWGSINWSQYDPDYTLWGKKPSSGGKSGSSGGKSGSSGGGSAPRGNVITLEPWEFSSFITPEEMRRGIVAQFYQITDWYLAATMSGPQDPQGSYTGDKAQTPVANSDRDNLAGAGKKATTSTSAPANPSSNNILTDRQRYVQSLVEAEYYRRRMMSRSVPAVSSPFNPYPVAGFPGLILTPSRPILGYVSQVSHHINVEAGSGTTSVSMSSPRYWDEGEVWCWFGGEEMDDWAIRNFPDWHNRKTIATNNADPNTYVRRQDENGSPMLSALDRFYSFLLDTVSIEYSSNNVGAATPETVNLAYVERDPGPLAVNPENLSILEYNACIASLDDQGRFAPGTLAERFYGPIRPYDTVESTASVESQIEYTERYGVRERELLEDFLGNRFDTVNGRVVLHGPTFGGDKLNSIQNAIIEYMKDLESRGLGGGT